MKTIPATTSPKNNPIITLPRIIIGIVILCLMFQIQKSKSVELPKYTTPEYVKQSVLERVNSHRASVHAVELTLSDSLSAEARRYCEMIAKGNLQANLSALHFSTASNKRDVEAWDNQKGVLRNVAVFESASGSPALDAMRTWLDKNDDANNLENGEVALTGIGVVKKGNTYFICQLFAPRR